jgi:hypothetical protein
MASETSGTVRSLSNLLRDERAVCVRKWTIAGPSAQLIPRLLPNTDKEGLA